MPIQLLLKRPSLPLALFDSPEILPPCNLHAVEGQLLLQLQTLLLAQLLHFFHELLENNIGCNEARGWVGVEQLHGGIRRSLITQQ